MTLFIYTNVIQYLHLKSRNCVGLMMQLFSGHLFVYIYSCNVLKASYYTYRLISVSTHIFLDHTVCLFIF